MQIYQSKINCHINCAALKNHKWCISNFHLPNKVTLVGRLGKEPEIRHTQDKAPIATLSLATTDYRKDSAGKSAPHTEWHRAVLFGVRLEVV